MFKKIIVFLSILSTPLWGQEVNSEQNEPLSILYHWVDAVSPDGTLITLEDGSQWKVGQWWHDLSASWTAKDLIQVTEVEKYLELYINFIRFHNLHTGEIVWCHRISPPRENSPSAHRITAIDDDLFTIDNSIVLHMPNNSWFRWTGWNIGDRVFLYSQLDGNYQIQNLKGNEATYYVRDRVISNVQVIKIP